MRIVCKHHQYLGGLLIAGLIGVSAAAQQQPLPQQVPPQVAGQQPPPVQVPAGFQLNAIQQAFVDQVLAAWQAESAKIVTFKCSFERWEYHVAFTPRVKDQEVPLNKNLGELSYQRPDKGSFQITEISTFQVKPVPPGEQPPEVPQGDWIKQPNAVGEHWVCDGKSVFEYRHDQKELVERPIPPHLQGKSIVDGPLPFLFGADAAKLKQRYFMRIHEQSNAAQIRLVARPRDQAQAADFTEVEVILNRERLLPEAMRVWMPNKDQHVYIFNLAGAQVNSPLARVQSWFERPRVPFGWKRVVEQMPVPQAAQAGQPVQTPR